MQVCGLIKCAGLWADILLRLTQIQTVGFAMFRLLCYVLHNSVAKPGACTCFYIFVPRGERTGLVVRASDSESGDPGSILGLVGVLFP